MKVLSKQKDDEWEKKLNELKQTHKAEIVKLKVELKAQKNLLQRSQDEVKARNGFDTKERALLQEIRRLKDEREGLVRELDAERALVRDNYRANGEQRAALKQAQQDLAEFEAMKAELIELKRGISQKTEVRDACAKLETDRRKMQKACNDRVRSLQAELDTTKEKLASAERAVKELQNPDGEDDDDNGMDD